MKKNDYDAEVLTHIRTDLYLFYRMITASKFKTNLKAPHIKKISKELMRMVRGDFKRLCVALPPRHSKSSLLTISFPLYLIFNNPKLNIVIVNNTAELSEKFGIAIREYVKEYGQYFNVYLSDIKHSNRHLMFCNKDGELYTGSIRLMGAMGSITGQDCDYILLDDIYKGFEDITPSLLQKKIDWFKTIILQRLEPHSRICILNTRWHTQDIVGYLKENNPQDYKFIEYSALDENDKPLWSEKYGDGSELIELREEMGERLFQSIYQQKPLNDTSDFFEVNNLRFGLPNDYNPSSSVRCWDIAYGEEVGVDSDYTASVKMVKSNDDYVITDAVRGRFGNSTKDVVINTAISDTPNVKIKIETGVGASAKLLYNEWSQLLRGYYLEELKPVTSKVDRATPLRYAISDGKVWINIQDDIVRDALMQELRSFPNGTHDDLVDATAYCYSDIHNTTNTNIGLGIVQL